MNFITTDSIETYHGNKEYLGRSELKDFIRSPYHYYMSHLASKSLYKIEKPTDATLIGQMVHSIILEPEKFFDIRPSVINKLNGNTKGGKAQLLEIEERTSHGEIVVYKHIYDPALSIVNNLYKNPAAKKLCEGGFKEHSLYWNDPKTGLKLKARPDIIHDECLCDIKTTNDASFKSFKTSVFNYYYHLQAAFQIEGIKNVFDRAIKEFVLIVIENKEPYASTIYLLSKETIKEGLFLMHSQLPIFKECKDRNEWHGYESREI